MQCLDCDPGEEPTTVSGATNCTHCSEFGDMHISNTGRACGACPAGKEPNEERHECVECGAGEYSDGSQCLACAAGSQPKDDQSDCDQCLIVGTNQYSPDGVACVTCGRGTEPLTNRTACQSCAFVGDAYVSATGDPCTETGLGDDRPVKRHRLVRPTTDNSAAPQGKRWRAFRPRVTRSSGSLLRGTI